MLRRAIVKRLLNYPANALSARRRGLAALLLLAAARAFADDLVISTDRPAVTDSSAVVPPGALLVESGLEASDNAGQYVLDLPQGLLRYGLTTHTELRLTLPDYYHALPGSSAASGFGDVELGIKQHLGSLAGVDFLLIPSLSVPTGAQAITSHGYDPSVLLPWSRSLSATWTVAGQLASYWPTIAGRHDQTSEVTLLFDRQLSAASDAFLEYAGDFPQRGGSQQLLHAGCAWRMSAHQQLDVHAGAGLSAAAPRWFVGVGYSWLLLP